ncbi:MAG: metal-sensitive transcriptional regulator [Anaerolineae bacterium]
MIDKQGSASDGKETDNDLGNILARLRRLEGQVRGLQRMLAEGRDCGDIIAQYLAARAALDEVGARILDAELERCLRNGEPQAERIGRVVRLWLRTSH